MKRSFVALAMGVATLPFCVGASGADDEPQGRGVSQVPVTRKDMKEALEGSKRNVPRLPLPPVTEEEKARAEEAAKKAAEGGEATKTGRSSGLGGGIVNNGRMRNYYLADYNVGRQPGTGQGQGQGRPQAAGPGGGVGFSREAEPGLSLGNAFQTQLFWVVSRANNCTYCMGHQEAKLTAAGLSDDDIAALDGNWSDFDAAKRAALVFTAKLTNAPHTLADTDIQALRAHYNDAQITEIILAVANFNAMNRWTGPLRIPQEERHVFLKPTSEKYASIASSVAPAADGSEKAGFVAPRVKRRPALESREAAESALEAARKRAPRIKLADASEARELLNGSEGDAVPQWVRLLAVFPRSGAGRVASRVAAQEKGSLDSRTKAIIAWVSARNDRAWYALGHAKQRLLALGFTEDQIYALDKPEQLESPLDRELVKFARKITLDPALVDDDDFARIRALLDDKKVAEVVYQITEAASFDRITEAAGLTLEP
jgi:AhpD family alkylhydroperoxidase